MQYQHRILEAKLKEYLNFFSVVGLTGPKQSGKSTLLLNLLGDYNYLTFDDHRVVDAFYSDPVKFVRQNQTKTIFDEVQNDQAKLLYQGNPLPFNTAIAVMNYKDYLLS